MYQKFANQLSVNGKPGFVRPQDTSRGKQMNTSRGAKVVVHVQEFFDLCNDIVFRETINLDFFLQRESAFPFRSVSAWCYNNWCTIILIKASFYQFLVCSSV